MMLMQDFSNILYKKTPKLDLFSSPFSNLVCSTIETSNTSLNFSEPFCVTSLAWNGHPAGASCYVNNSRLGTRFSLTSSPEMAPMVEGTSGIIVMMGVSGAGKSTIGNLLADTLKCSFLDADDFHPDSNKEKMKEGIPLSEEDRMPWLQALRQALTEYITSGKRAVLACSALRKTYRELLRTSDPTYVPSRQATTVTFVLLDVPLEVLSDRLHKRLAKGEHFMPPSLLKSQLELLEIDPSEGVLQVDATQSPSVIVDIIRDEVNNRKAVTL